MLIRRAPFVPLPPTHHHSIIFSGLNHFIPPLSAQVSHDDSSQHNSPIIEGNHSVSVDQSPQDIQEPTSPPEPSVPNVHAADPATPPMLEQPLPQVPEPAFAPGNPMEVAQAPNMIVPALGVMQVGALVVANNIIEDMPLFRSLLGFGQIMLAVEENEA